MNEKIIANCTEQIEEVENFLNHLSYDNGRCYVLCVGFTELTPSVYCTMQVEDIDEHRYKAVYNCSTRKPSLVNKHMAEQIMATAKFTYQGKPATPKYRLVRIDEWGKEMLKILTDCKKMFEQLAKDGKDMEH